MPIDEKHSRPGGAVDSQNKSGGAGQPPTGGSGSRDVEIDFTGLERLANQDVTDWSRETASFRLTSSYDDKLLLYFREREKEFRELIKQTIESATDGKLSAEQVRIERGSVVVTIFFGVLIVGGVLIIDKHRLISRLKIAVAEFLIDFRDSFGYSFGLYAGRLLRKFFGDL